MSAIKNETHEQNNMEPADIVSVSMSPPSSDHNESTGLFTFFQLQLVVLHSVEISGFFYHSDFT